MPLLPLGVFSDVALTPPKHNAKTRLPRASLTDQKNDLRSMFNKLFFSHQSSHDSSHEIYGAKSERKWFNVLYSHEYDVF